MTDSELILRNQLAIMLALSDIYRHQIREHPLALIEACAETAVYLGAKSRAPTP